MIILDDRKKTVSSYNQFNSFESKRIEEESRLYHNTIKSIIFPLYYISIMLQFPPKVKILISKIMHAYITIIMIYR